MFFVGLILIMLGIISSYDETKPGQIFYDYANDVAGKILGAFLIIIGIIIEIINFI